MEFWREQDLKFKKYHEVVIYRSHSTTTWRGTHTEVLHVGISGKGPAQDTQKVGSEQEMEGWMMERNMKLIPSVGDEDSDKNIDI